MKGALLGSVAKAAFVTLLLAAPMSLARAEPSASSPRTIAVIKGTHSVDELAVDHGHIAWINDSGGPRQCGARVRLLKLSSRRKMTLGRRNCRTTDSLVLVGGRVFWNQAWGSNTEAGGKIMVATAAKPLGRVLTTWGQSECEDFGCPGASLADDGRTVVLAAAGSVEVVVGDVLKSLFERSHTGRFATVAIGGGNVAIATLEIPEDPGLRPVISPTVEVHALRDGSLTRVFTLVAEASFALAISRTHLAVWTQEALEVYQLQSGKRLWSKDLFPAGLSTRLRIAAPWLIFQGSYRGIDAADVLTGKRITLVRGGGRVTSFDVEAGRLIWAEQVGGVPRFIVRSVPLPH